MFSVISGTHSHGLLSLGYVSERAVVAFELKAGQRALHLHCLVILREMLAIIPPSYYGESNNAYVRDGDTMSAECLGIIKGVIVTHWFSFWI